MNIKAIITAFSLSAIGLSAIASEPQPYEKNGWGISALGEFSTSKDEGWVGTIQPPEGYIKTHEPKFYQNLFGDEDDYTIGAIAFYNWHPFVGSKNDVAKHFFVRPGLGGGYNRFGWNKQFVFYTQVFLGYTWRIKQIGLDIFTGPTAKFGAKVFSDQGPCGIETETVPVSALPVVYDKMYSGGASWSFGIGFNYRHIGITLSYNLPMTKNFEHYWSPDNSRKAYPDNKMHKTLTAGLLYYF